MKLRFIEKANIKRSYGSVAEFERLLNEFVDSGAEAAEIDFTDKYKTARTAHAGLKKAVVNQGRENIVRIGTCDGKLVLMRVAED